MFLSSAKAFYSSLEHLIPTIMIKCFTVHPGVDGVMISALEFITMDQLSSLALSGLTA